MRFNLLNLKPLHYQLVMQLQWMMNKWLSSKPQRRSMILIKLRTWSMQSVRCAVNRIGNLLNTCSSKKITMNRMWSMIFLMRLKKNNILLNFRLKKVFNSNNNNHKALGFLASSISVSSWSALFYRKIQHIWIPYFKFFRWVIAIYVEPYGRYYHWYRVIGKPIQQYRGVFMMHPILIKKLFKRNILYQ